MPDALRQTNIIRTASVKFAATQAGLTTAISYGCVVTGAGFTPSANTQEVPATGCAPASTIAAPSSWALDLAYLQDPNNSAGGLSGYLFDNDGTLQWVEVTPSSPAMPAMTAQVSVVSGQIYGTFGELLVATASCPVQGKPTHATWPATMAADEQAEQAQAA